MNQQELTDVLKPFGEQLVEALGSVFSKSLVAVVNSMQGLADAFKQINTSTKSTSPAGKGKGNGSSLGKTIGIFTAELTGAVLATQKFVGALNPFVLEYFEYSIQNLQATIGQSLVPIIEIATETLQDFAGIIDQTMKDLQPIIAKIAEVLSRITVVIVQLLNAGLSALVPLIDAMANGLQMMLKATLQLVAAFLSMVGANSTLNEFVSMFEKQLNPARVANARPREIGVKSIEQIIKDIQTASFGAGAGVKDDKAFLSEIVELLKDIRDGKKGPTGGLDDIFRKDVWEEFFKDPFAALKK